MNEIRLKTFKDAGVIDQKSTSYETNRNIEKEVRKIRALIRQNKYLEKPFEVQQHTDITKNTLLADDLVNFTAIAQKNLSECLPKMLRKEPYKINIVFRTRAEKEESEKIENCTIAEIKKKIISLLEQFSNKNMWLDLYKGKCKQAHIDFFNHLAKSLKMNKNLYQRTI